MTQDARPTLALMKYDAQKKSVAVTYLLWFFLFWLSAHRFYAGRYTGALLQIITWVLGLCLAVVGVGLFIWAVLGLWLLIDALLIPGWIRSHNVELAERITDRTFRPESERAGIGRILGDMSGGTAATLGVGTAIALLALLFFLATR